MAELDRWHEEAIRKHDERFSDDAGDASGDEKNASAERTNDEYRRRAMEILGRIPGDPGNADPRLAREQARLVMANEEISRFRGPLILVVIGVVLSTAGSVLGLYA